MTIEQFPGQELYEPLPPAGQESDACALCQERFDGAQSDLLERLDLRQDVLQCRPVALASTPRSGEQRRIVIPGLAYRGGGGGSRNRAVMGKLLSKSGGLLYNGRTTSRARKPSARALLGR
jgi:hypothetical protein